ncbi:hemolytic protein HlpA [Nocardioides salsibiostraticola]
MLETPVVLFAFNRPQLTRDTLAAVRRARPDRLFLIVDGPRAAVPSDQAACAATREELDEIDWPCTVERRYAEENLGCEANVELGLDWVFAQVPEAIVLEDDCLADPTFFDYCVELLDRYRDDPRVWQISGSGLGVPEPLFEGRSYAFTAWASVWGWATWSDRWQQHREVFTRSHVGPDGGRPERVTPAAPQPGLLVTRSGEHHFAEAAVSLDTITHGWDKHWWLTMMTHGRFAASPAVNLVQNLGWGPDATHGVNSARRDQPRTSMGFPLVHPTNVALDVEVERELELVLSRVGGRTARIARRLVRHSRLRRTARRIADSGSFARVSRTISRFTDRSHRG